MPLSSHVFINDCTLDDEDDRVDSSVPSAGAEDRPIVLTGLQCTGNETRLSDCSKAEFTSQCDHTMDAGVFCSKFF